MMSMYDKGNPNERGAWKVKKKNKETHEDPGSGTTWSPRAPTHAIQSWASVIFFRFAMPDKPSTSWRLCPMFYATKEIWTSAEESKAGAHGEMASTLTSSWKRLNPRL
jgi:hypothetical protein